MAARPSVGRRFAALNNEVRLRTIVRQRRQPARGPGCGVPSELDRDRTDEEHSFFTFVQEKSEWYATSLILAPEKKKLYIWILVF